jgi:hypothetical protein
MAEPESIMQLGIEAARDGNKDEARNLFRLLTREEPNNSQAWLWLAGVAENREERQYALERVLDLEPGNEMAYKGLQAMGVDPEARQRAYATVDTGVAAGSGAQAVGSYDRSAASGFDDDDPFAELDSLSDVMADGPAAVRREKAASIEPIDAGEAVTAAAAGAAAGAATANSRAATSSARGARNATMTPSSRDIDDEVNNRSGGIPWLPLLLALAALAALLWAVWFFLFRPDGTPQPVPTGVATEVSTPDPNATAAIPTVDPNATAVLPTVEAPTTVVPTAEPPPPTPVPPEGVNPEIVPPGTTLESQGWGYNFSQPNFAAPIIGNLGTFAPQGRFVVVLTLVSNNTGQEQPLPADFVALRDAQGRVYTALPEVSTAYVIPGVNADLSHAQPIPANGGAYSVALIFDVAPDATNLVFFAPSNPAQGWQVLSSVQ